jgi:hypothetical protein
MAAGYRSSEIRQAGRNDRAQISRAIDADLHRPPEAAEVQLARRIFCLRD